MKKLKKILVFTLTLVLLFSLFSCHGSRMIPKFEMPESFDTEKTYEITFWAKNDSNQTQVNIYNEAIESFEELYPNINVTIKRYSDYGKIYNDVITNIQTGTTPNVCITYPDHIATYMTGTNVMVPLDELMSDDKYGLGGSELRFDGVSEDEIIDKFLTECKIGDTYYALPFMRSTEACYVNKTYVEALGFTLPEVLTWDFIFEVARAAMEKDSDGNYKINGQKTLIPIIYKSTDNMMIQALRQKNAEYSNASGEILIFNDTTKEILYDVRDAVADEIFSTFKISSYPGNFFNAGQCLFAIDSTAGATWIGAEAPLIDIPEDKLVEFETEVMAVPQYNEENIAMISQGPSVCVFNKDDPGEVLASWLFAQYLLTNTVQIEFAKTEGYVPVTSRAQTDDAYTDYLSRAGEDNEEYYDVKIAASRLLLDNMDKTFVTPVFNGSTSLRNAAGQLIEEVAKAQRRGKTVDDDFITELYGEVTSLYRLDSLSISSDTSADKQPLGELPTEAVVLLSVIGAIWLCIGAYYIIFLIKKGKK